MSSSTNTTDHDHQLLGVGQQCSAPSCHLIDFLPFKCQHCNENFCGDHFSVSGHKCPKYDESKHNRVAPSCPLCNEPVAIPPGQDPNVRMDRHINTECSVITGKAAKKSTPVCTRGKCGKVLFAPISCDKCRKQFCASHRFPSDHDCVSLSTASTATKLRSKPAMSTPSLPTFKSSYRPTTFAARPSASTGSSNQASISLPSISIANPFNPADRRAKAERESRRKAMMERAKKGLLSEEEKLMLAGEEAERAQAVEEKKDKECVIM
ncbi:hypothetical protein CONPUDRAFT_82142 [Coniophora puteana RWD-64-598 SS2]|uniref:AN1-type domain-containing protein n=1 Tax=Coniophora puteana (strain RWD-64-598) TaxID=741705 RepID=A0A5M3MRB2_CONPW|nr:uncharacterized protein CONPUDRAFT_82142 [Coniophora puteana RWD-64-598 SS2]EIW81071.1 hypothetical protein CONPUDRAFT_82142 [Coniophora puteana RWD-64-598 SS2]